MPSALGHFAIDGRIEQTPQALRVKRAEEALHDAASTTANASATRTPRKAPISALSAASSARDTIERVQMMFMLSISERGVG